MANLKTTGSLANPIGQVVPKEDVIDMIKEYVSRLSGTTGVNLNTELLAIQFDMTGINRMKDLVPDSIVAFFAVEEDNGQKKNTMILMPVKDNAFMRETELGDYLAIERWDPAPAAINIPTPQQVLDDTNDSLLNELFD